MEAQEKQFNEQQALGLVNEMISIAKGNIYNSYFYFILWGWISVISGIATYILLEMKMYEYTGWLWAVMGPLGGLASFIYGRSQGKKKKVRTFIDSCIRYTWIAFFISGAILYVYFCVTAQYLLVNPVVLLSAGTATFMTGVLLKFRPLIVGGILLWTFCAVSLPIHTEVQSLVASVGFLCGYVIPGYMLKAKYDKENV